MSEFLAAAEAARYEVQVRHEPQFERVVASFPTGVEVGFAPESGLFGLWRAWADAEPIAAPDPAT